MAEGRETRVSYEAIAKFAELHRALRKTRQELTKTQAAEKAFNAVSAKSYADTTKAFKESIKTQKEYNNTQSAVENTTRKKTEALRKEAAQLDRTRKANVRFVDSVGDVNTATGEVVESTEKAVQASSRWGNALDKARQFLARNATETRNNAAAQDALTRAKERQFDASENLRIAELRLSELMKKSGQNASRIAAAELRVTRARRAVAAATQNVEGAVKRLNSEGNKLPPTFRKIEQGGNRLFNSMQKFANWRPRLVPPFVALIPIIGAVVAAINPLIALMGSLGSVAIGLAGSIGSLSGAFLALPGILSGVAAGIAGVIASMGGVGNVFKTYAAMQKAANSGANTGKSQAERADELADAERNLSKAQRNVQKAQENLNKARQQALKDLVDLRLEVSRASLNEERAVANLRKAQEDYWNVLADPGSTLGDKLDAAASVKEAEADLQDVRKKNIDNQKALNEAEKKGVKNSEAVLDAQENLADAYEAQRDAQRNLGKVQRGETAASIKAVNEYNQALAELSPSARKFVLAILAMEKQWKSFRREMQETFFSQFVGELDRLPNLLRNLRSFLLPAAKAMGQFVKSFMILMDSPEWSNDLKTIGEQNGTVIKNLGDGFLDLATALKDITIAAGPFTEWMTKGFAEGAENFKDFIGNARETGRLAAWLDKVAERMQKWWTVVKNVGLTIFNYSAAAEDFGGWLLDGFVELSEGWRKASEEARKEGSPFQEYLENIKPLLTEVKGLFGDFFGWLRDEMMDPENIKDAQDLVKLIRDDLGPAIGRLLDALAKTDIDEKFVEALSSIIDSLATIMENGGGDAFETFFDIIEGFFGFLADVTENIDPAILSAILKFVGGVAAFAFIGKFTGITNLLGAIMGFNGKNGLFTMLGNMVKDFGKLDKMKFAGLLGKAGLVAAIASLVVITWNDAQKTAPFGDSLRESLFDPSKENLEKTRELGIEDGNAIKWLTGPTSPLKFLSPGLGSIGAGGVSEILSFIDDMLGTTMHTEFDNFLEDTMVNLDNFSKDVVNWGMTEFLPGWNKFWGDVKRNWEAFWAPIVEWWDKNISQPLQTAWKRLQDAFAYGVAWVNHYVITPLRMAWYNFTVWFDTTFVQPVKKKWGEFQTNLKKGWDWINNYIITPFKNGFNNLQTTLGNIVTGMGNKWNELRKKFADPVNFVIDTVYNNGIRSFWNGINKSLNLKLALPYINKVKFAEGGVMPNPTRRSYAYATGGVLPGYTPGRDVHDFVSPTGGRLSLSGGEAIMRPEFTKLMGGKKGIDELNRKARKGEAFANGGVWKGGNTQHFAGGGIWEVAGDLWDKFTGFFSDPLKYVKEGIGNLINPLLKNIGGGDFGKMISGIPGSIVSGLANFSKDKTKTAKRKADDLEGGGPAPANVMGWRAQWAAVKAAFPSARLNSAYRNPSANAKAGGAKGSYHTQGRAIDVTPSMAIFNWIKKNYPNSRELIYSPAGSRQLQNGREKFWGQPVRGDHWDHVHWAMRKGGVIPGLYDNGGWLPHGGMAVNRSGKPEAVLDPVESRALKALLSGSGLSSRPASFGATAATAVNAAPQVIDNSINIDNVTIQNPVPEKTSDSLPKAIRRIGYMNEARSR